jgi:hypothetical protein
MTTPIEALDRLDAHAKELDTLSRGLAEVQRQLEPVEVNYQAFVDDFEVGLYLKSEQEDGPRLPSEAMRLKLARRAMAPELLGKRDGLIRKRDRMAKRIDDLSRVCNAERSILSALKEEMNATSVSVRRAA